jgi:hypothetical protein
MIYFGTESLILQIIEGSPKSGTPFQMSANVVSHFYSVIIPPTPGALPLGPLAFRSDQFLPLELPCVLQH